MQGSTSHPDSRPGQVTAVLGPTNTGKTHLAIERMLGHTSGMIGFPLRLLARENYDRVVKQKGRGQVALVTGEEKILPPNPRYFLCTVESMPVDRPVEFLAIDEIQLCADPERGHVFTDRLLHARGLSETMFLGSDTMRGMIRDLVPRAEITSRPRMSVLRYSGPRKLTKLPTRSAVVAFSASDVYATAELMRRNRGGTAVVLGALSPRTRNAQVQMFEEGEVDYLVATDAIGMGLNLNLDHVAFAKLAKFDGRMPRPLTAPEVGQIAGRAGRHMSDGTFGTTANIGEIDEEIVEAVESHRFDPVQALCWRNRDLDFKSPQALIKSLEAPPPAEALTRARDAEDYNALVALARDPEIRELASDPGAVRLLWEVCQIPDFRKTLSEQHTRLLAQVYRHLRGSDGKLPEDWVARHLEHLDKTDGDIDSLVQRIAHVRTWTYITHRGDWLADTAHWQARARQIEDRLSDALHDSLTQRFVDKRTAALVKRLKDGSELIGAVRKGGEVLVEGQYVGRLQGFRFELDQQARGEDQRPLQAAARRALSGEIPRRVQRLEQDDDGAIGLSDTGVFTWRGEVVGRLEAGAEPLKPKVVADDTDFLDGAQRERIRKRLADWFDRHRRNRLAKLFQLAEAELPARARGLAFQLVEALGTIDRREVAQHLQALGRQERKALNQLGVRIGRESVWLPAMLHPQALRMKALLTAVHQRRAPAELPTDRSAAFRPGETCDDATCRALGYRRIQPARRGGKRSRQQKAAVAVRVDALERLAGALHKLNPRGPFTPTDALAQILDGDRQALDVAMPALGYAPFGHDGASPAFRPRGRPGGRATPAADGAAQASAGALEPPEPAAAPARRRKPEAAPAQTPAHGDGTPTEAPCARPAKAKRKRRKAKPAAAAPADGAAPAPSRAGGPAAGPDAPAKAKRRREDGRGTAQPGGTARRETPEVDPDHPFAKLKDLTFAR